MSRDNLDSMRVANVASGKLPGLERLGIEPAPLEAIAPRYLGHVSGEKRLEAWRVAGAARLTRQPPGVGGDAPHASPRCQSIKHRRSRRG